MVIFWSSNREVFKKMFKAIGNVEKSHNNFKLWFLSWKNTSQQLAFSFCCCCCLGFFLAVQRHLFWKFCGVLLFFFPLQFMFLYFSTLQMDESYGFDIAVILVESLSYIPFRIYFFTSKENCIKWISRYHSLIRWKLLFSVGFLL